MQRESFEHRWSHPLGETGYAPQTRFPERHRNALNAGVEWSPGQMSVGKDALARLRGGASVALLGPRGGGKTQMACAIASVFERAYYFRAASLFAAMKSWYDLNGQDQAHNNRQLVRVPLLVIDDVQERVESEHEDKLLTHLFDKRYGEQKPTLLIANLLPEAFEKHVGTSVADRVREGGALLVCNWPSYRGRTAE